MREIRDSLILDDEEKRRTVRQFVDEERKVKSFKLEYRGSRDGWLAADFHRMSDYKGPTLTLMKTSFNKILGGFSQAQWDRSDQKKSDPAFIFSYDLKKLYKPNSNHYTTYHDSSYGCYFGAKADLIIGN
jgi:hypothetical protein